LGVCLRGVMSVPLDEGGGSRREGSDRVTGVVGSGGGEALGE